MNTIPHDPELPGLALLLQPQLLLQHIPGLPSALKARIDYIKYKPATNCVVGYQLDGEASYNDVYARALRPDDFGSFEVASQEDRIRLEELAVELRIFPDDRRLPGLRSLRSRERRYKLLKSLFPQQPAWWHGQLERLAYKPERRYVARLIVEQQPMAVLKFHTAAAYQQALQVALLLGQQPGLAALLGSSERHALLAYAWVEGQVASTALLDQSWSPSNFAQIGAALADFHQRDCTGLKSYRIADEFGALDAAVQAATLLCPELDVRLQKLLRILKKHRRAMYSPQGLIHGDFYARQVILQGNNCALIDTDEAAQGDKLLDLANMLAHIEYDVICGTLRPERASHMRSAFLDGYFQHAQLIGDQQVTQLTALRLLLLLTRPFRAYTADWPAQMAAIVERCEELVRL